MKSIAPLLLLLICVFAGCQKDPNGPEAITRQFITLMGNGDNEAATLLSTEATHRFLDFRTQSMELLDQDPVQPLTIETINCLETGESANCTFCCDQNGDEMSIPLIRQGDKWLVHIEIDDLIKDFEKELKKEMETEE